MYLAEQYSCFKTFVPSGNNSKLIITGDLIFIIEADIIDEKSITKPNLKYKKVYKLYSCKTRKYLGWIERDQLIIVLK